MTDENVTQRRLGSGFWARGASPISRWEVAIMAILGSVLAGYARYANNSRPGVWYPDGFYGFYDQGQYLNIARRLAYFSLPIGRGEYTYGLGYPIFAAPFYRLGFEGDPFAPVDVLAFGFVVAATAVVGARLGGRVVGIVSACLVAFATPVLELMSTPWNSTVTISAFLIVLLVATSPVPVSILRIGVLGLLAGLSFAARYPDGIAVGLVCLVPIAAAPNHRWRLLASLAAGAALVLLPVLWTHDRVLGSWSTTPYASHLREGGTSDQSLAHYDVSSIPRHALETFVTAEYEGVKEQPSPLLLRSPFLLLLPFGVWVIGRRRGRDGVLVVAAMAVSVVFALFYLSFAASSGEGIKFGSFRYWEMWMPLWTITSVIGGRHLLALLGDRVDPIGR